MSNILFGQSTYLDSLKHELSIAESAKEKLKISRKLALEFCYKDSSKCFFYAQNMLAVAKETDSFDYMGSSHLIVAVLFKRYNNFAAAYDNCLQAIEFYKVSENRNGMASCYTNLSQMLEEQANYPKALEYIQLAFRMDSLDNNKRGMGLDFNGIGRIFLNQSEFDKAKKYFLRTLNIGREINDKKLVASSTSNLGMLYEKLGDSERAIKYKLEVLDMYKSLSDSTNIGIILNNIGHHHIRQDVPHAGLRYLEEAESIFKKLKDRRRLAEVWLNLGIAYTQLNQLGPALNYFERSLKVASDLGIKKTVMDCHKEISNLFARQRQFKSAFQHHVKFQQMKDSIFNDENNGEILKLRNQLAIEQKEAENQKLRETQVQNENIIFKQRLLGIGIIVGLLLLTIIALILYKAYRQKRSSNELLKLQQNEIRQKNVQLEELGKVKDKFLSVITHDMSEPLQNLKHTFELLENKQDIASVPISIWLQLKNQIEGISDLSNYWSGQAGNFMALF